MTQQGNLNNSALCKITVHWNTKWVRQSFCAHRNNELGLHNENNSDSHWELHWPWIMNWINRFQVSELPVSLCNPQQNICPCEKRVYFSLLTTAVLFFRQLLYLFIIILGSQYPNTSTQLIIVGGIAESKYVPSKGVRNFPPEHGSAVCQPLA